LLSRIRNILNSVGNYLFNYFFAILFYDQGCVGRCDFLINLKLLKYYVFLFAFIFKVRFSEPNAHYLQKVFILILICIASQLSKNIFKLYAIPPIFLRQVLYFRINTCFKPPKSFSKSIKPIMQFASHYFITTYLCS